jgi:uncharacterized membrane protein YphA (DoxX/SURF4 family)
MLTAAAFIGRLIVGSVFLYAGAAKAQRRDQFARAVRTYEIGGAILLAVVVAVVPALEISVGVLLLLGLATVAVASAAAALLALFAVATARQLVRGRAVDCGCFGSTGMHRPSWSSVVRNLGLLALMVAAISRPITAAGLDQVVLSRPATMPVANAIALAESLALLALAAAIYRVARRVSRRATAFRQWEEARR